MSQPQLSVREKAREMWAEFRKNKEKLNHILEKETLDFIDQIITLALEEKIGEIEKLSIVPESTPHLSPYISGVNEIVRKVLLILKQ